MSNVAFIPARAGSKSIKNKNIIPVAGHPLIYWVLKAANDSKWIDEIFVSTDGDTIKTTVEELGLNKVKVITRSVASANDTATSESALLEFCNNHEFDNVIFLQATSPLTTTKDIDGAFEKFINSDKKSLISSIRRYQFIWDTNGNPINYDPINRPRRQDWDGYQVENGAFYISSRKEILSSQCRITRPVEYWEMSQNTLFEVDEPQDLDIINTILAKN